MLRVHDCIDVVLYFLFVSYPTLHYNIPQNVEQKSKRREKETEENR